MTTYATRRCGAGWIAGVARLRLRDGEPAIDIRHGKHASTPVAALEAAIEARPPDGSSVGRKQGQGSLAQGQSTDRSKG